MQHPRVSVVILNWNGKSFLQRFLPGVMEHLPVWASLVVADNGSTDQSLAYVNRAFPDVHTMDLGGNFGYAGGYNAALSRISAEYYILLNSDIEVTPAWIEPIISLMDSDPDIAACQPKILSFERPSFFEYAGASGGYIDKYGYPFCRGRVFQTIEEDQGQYDDTREVFWASGACLFFRAEVFHSLGGFEEGFFAHMEEIDLCWRANNAGYKVMVCPESVVYHVGGGSLPKSNPLKTFLNFRNNLWMLARNMPAGVFFSTLMVRMILDKMAALKFLFAGHTGDFLAVLKAYAACARQPGKMRKTGNTARHGLSAMMWKRSLLWHYYVRKRKKFSELP